MAYFEQVKVTDTGGNPVNPATETTLQTIQGLTTAINGLLTRLDEQNDNQVALLSAILEKMAMPTRYDELRVSVENNGNGLGSPYYNLMFGSVGDFTTGASRPLMVPAIYNTSMAGATYIYQNIQVS